MFLEKENKENQNNKNMGYYINNNSKGQFLGHLKVKSLIEDGAQKVSGEEFVPDLICVVNNGLFDAAGYCYSQQEYEAFKHPDGRSRTWLTHPLAAQLSGYKEQKVEESELQ